MLSQCPLPVAQLKLPFKPEAFLELDDTVPQPAAVEEATGPRVHLESFSSTASTSSGISPLSHLKRSEKREKENRKLQAFLRRPVRTSEPICEWLLLGTCSWLLLGEGDRVPRAKEAQL